MASPTERSAGAVGPAHAAMPAWAPLAAFLIPLVAYLATMPPDITFEDAGIFASACWTGGLPHPPGYPLHTLLCVPTARLGDLLSMSPAQGAALLSALANAAAAATLAWVFHQHFRDAPFAVAVALAYAFGMHSWSQAIIPEVYSLNAFLFAAALALTLRYRQCGRLVFAYAAALAAGLGLSNHWPLFLAAAPACLFLLLAAPGRLLALLRPGPLAICVALLAAGLLPYARLFFVPEGAYLFEGPVRDAADFAAYVSRDIYLDRIERIEVAQRLSHMFHGIPIAFEEHPLAVSLLALPGVWACAQRRGPWTLAAWLWLLLSTLAFLKLAAGYYWIDEVERHTFAVYHQVAFAAMAFFIGEGVAWLARRLRLPAAALPAAGMALPLVAFSANYGANDRSEDTLALRYAEVSLATYPRDALAEFGGDLTFPLTYLRHTRGARPDVEEADLPDLLGYDEFDRLTLTAEEMAALARLGRPLVLQRPLSGSFSIVNYGTVEELVPESGRSDLVLDAENLEFLLDLVRRYPYETDTWNRNYIAQEIESLSRLMLLIRRDRPGRFVPAVQELYIAATATLPGQLGAFLARVVDGVEPLPAADILLQAEALRTGWPEMSRRKRAQLLHIEGNVFASLGDIAAAKRRFAASLRLSASAKENPAVVDMLQLHALEGDWDSYRALRARYRTLGRAKALDETDRLCAEATGAPCAPAPQEG